MTDAYGAFLASKKPRATASGFAPVLPWPAAMKPFQRDITNWACRRGRAAIFAGTGLGKTLDELAWAQQVAAHTGGGVLIFTPLAVAEQTVREAAKFGIEGVAYAPDRGAISGPITITNYERRDRFDLAAFAGVALDESGIIKDHDSKTRIELTQACATTPYLLCASATPAPNDWTELGQHSEFLGVMSAKEMLAMFFVHDGSVRAKGEEDWRLKRHAEDDFWRWLSSWAVMIRHPRDLGYDDESGYDLPPLHIRQVTVAVEYKPTGGMLFPMEAQTLQERIAARRDSVDERIVAAAEIILGSDECGSLNTTLKERLAITKTPSTAPSARQRAETGENIQGPIIRPTSTNGSGRWRSERSATPDAGKSTRPCPNIGGGQSHLSPQRIVGETAPCDPTTASASQNMKFCSSDRTGAAQSVTEPRATESDSASITATKQAESGDCCAPIAISGSGSSATTFPTSIAPSNICWKPDDQWIIWCNLNSEQEALERLFGDLCVSVYGSLAAQEKVDRIRRWIDGACPILVTKPSICGRGLNLQQCNKTIFVGLNDSFEQLYQAIRRCWRFGQAREVTAYLIASELEGAVVSNLLAKERKYERMADAMQRHMRDLGIAEVRSGRQAVSNYRPQQEMQVPTWLAA